MINESERIKNLGFCSGKIYIDDSGVIGTTFPIGTQTNPVSNIANALTIAATRSIKHFRIRGTFGAITETLSGYWIEGHTGPLGAPFLTLAAGVANAGTTFDHCMITGAANGWSIYENNCVLLDITGVQGLIIDSNLYGTIKLGSGITNFDSCVTVGGPITLDLDDIVAGTCIIHNFTGSVTIVNLDSAATVKIYSSAGANVTIAASCTAGTINIFGVAIVTDGGGGTTVNDYTIHTRIDRQLYILDFWSEPQEEIQLTDTVAPGTDVALPSVIVADLPAGATVERAIAMFKCRIIENTNAAVNKLQGGQHIQVESDAPGTYRDAISFVDDMFTIAANTREAGDVIIGDHDIAIEVDAHGNDTYLFKWEAALVDQANLQFNDAQTGLRIWYSV